MLAVEFQASCYLCCETSQGGLCQDTKGYVEAEMCHLSIFLDKGRKVRAEHTIRF